MPNLEEDEPRFHGSDDDEFTAVNEDDQHQSEEQIIKNALELCRRIYAQMGYVASEGFKFYDSKHPTEIMVWSIVETAYMELQGTELDDVLAEYLEEQDA